MHYSEFGRVLRSILRRTFYSITEVIHVGVSYLGLIVLVTAILAVTVPPVRDQALRAYSSVVLALQPAGYSLSFHDDLSNPSEGLDPYPLAYVSPIMASDELTWAQGADEVHENAIEGSKIDVDHLNFTRALADSEDQSAIPGVTNAQAQALRSYIARKYRIASSVAGAIINTVFKVGVEKNLDPQLILAVIAIESRYNPFAESHAGAQGLMQVMTKVHKDKFAAFGEGPMAAVHPLANIQVGTQILYDCIKRRGSIDGGLACYVGATGPSDGGYGNKVKAEWRRLALASGIPIQP